MQQISLTQNSNQGNGPLLCSECQHPMTLTRVFAEPNTREQLGTFYCRACQFVTAARLED